MNFPELFECDYSTYNIYSLNEELKKLNKITDTDIQKHEEQTGLGTLVVHAMTDEY